MKENVMVVCAHGDDEVIGCGGTIAKHIQDGDKVHVLIMADGVSSRNAVHQDYQKRNEAVLKAADILGHTVTQLAYFDNEMDSYTQLQIVKSIESEFAEHKPTIVYTHWPHDLNVDHRVTSMCTAVACRPIPGSFIERLFYFEVMSSTEWQTNGEIFNPNWFVDISLTIDIKLAALKCYDVEMRPYPHARSRDSVIYNSYRRGSSVGRFCAEAFILARGIC